MAENIEVAGLVTKLSIDDTDLEKSMAELSRQMKLTQSELKAASSGLTDFGKGTDGLKLKSDSLAKQLETQGIVVAKLKQEYDKAKDSGEKNADQLNKMEVRLNNAAAGYNKLDAELKATNAELVKQQKEAEIAASSWGKLSASLNESGTKLKSVGKEMSDAGKSLTMTLTAPLVAVGGLATKASIDFESAFAGVRKTVDATELEFTRLNAGIRDMSKNIPAAATEIAKVAEAAGQLGIKKESIMGFTRTMVDLGVATNLTSDQAATALARLANITQMPQTEFDKLGSTIVALGNNLATTESEIVEMGLRIAGAGNIVGMSEAQILAFAGSLSSVGIEAEAGGTAFSKLMVNIASAVNNGSEDLTSFAAVAGMTKDQFVQGFKTDAATAIVAFIEGLGKINKEGGNTFGVIDALGLSEIRLRDALLRSAGAGDVMRNSLELSSKAWTENTALTKEAEERYKTTASQLQIFKNRLNDIGITLGDALIPALLRTLDTLQPVVSLTASAAEGFAKLDPTLQSATIATVGLAAALGPTLFITGQLITSVGTIAGALGKFSGIVANAGGAAAVLTTAVRGLGTALMFLVANPVGITITAVAALTAGLVYLHKVMGKDSIPAVQSFGDASQKAMDQASGSFKKFRSEADGALQDTVKSAGTNAKEIGDAIAAGVDKGSKKAKKVAVDDMKDMVDDMKKEVDRSKEALNKLGDGLVQALKKRYDEAEKVQAKALDSRIDEEKKASEQIVKQYEKEQDQKIKALDRQLDEEKKASDSRLKIYDKEYTEKLKLIDEDAYRQVKAIQEQIDAIDKQTDTEDKSARQQEHRDRLAEYNKQLAFAETAEERQKIQQDLSKTIADYERKQLLEQRKDQKDALKDQIDTVKEASNKKKELLKQEHEDKKDNEKELLRATVDRLNDEKVAVKEHSSNLKEIEKERLESVKGAINDEKTEIKAYFAELMQQENLQAEARKMVVEGSQDDIVQLLESYAPKWQDAGQNFADSFSQGVNSGKQSMADAIKVALDLAPVIDGQVAELDRLQEKLKELEAAAKAAGEGGGGGGLGDIAAGFGSIATETDGFASSLTHNVNPAMRDFAETTKKSVAGSIDAFLGLRNKATVELNGLYWAGKEVSEGAAAVIADAFFGMGEQIESDLKTSHAERLKEMQGFFISSTSLTDEEKTQAIDALKERMKQEAEEVENGQNRVAGILSKALDEKRSLTKQEYDEITSIQKSMTEEGVRILSGSADQQKVILEKLRKESGDLSAQQAAEVTRNSIKQRDESVAATEEQYDRSIAQIIKLRDETGTISQEQADKLITEAKRQRDESVKAAEDMHQKVIAQAQAQAFEHAEKVDWQTGEILTKWGVLKNNMAKTWDEMLEDTKRNMRETKNSFSSNWAEIENFFKGIDLKPIGKNIIDGLRNGIKDGWKWVEESVSDLAAKLPEWIKKPLGIQSPSRVMMQLGEYTGEGLAIGMQNSLSDIRRQATAMAAAAIPGMDAVSMANGVGSGAAGSGNAPSTYNFEGMFAGANFVVRTQQDIETIAELVARKIYGGQVNRGRATGVTR